MTVQSYIPDPDLTLDEAMEDLVSAEDFLGFFKVPFDQNVVHVNRLHIMQRFHDYIEKAGDLEEYADEAKFAAYQQLLARAYEDFVGSDARTEKVFKVFQQGEPQTTFVSIDQLLS